MTDFVQPLSSEAKDKKLTQADSINEFKIHDLWFTQVKIITAVQIHLKSHSDI